MTSSPRSLRQRGFSIIEIMIGLVIGMFSVLIMLQLLNASGTQQRLTSTSADAQISGATVMYILDRELAQSGLGISAYTVLGCNLAYTTTTDSASVTLSALAPVTINSSLLPAGDANTDTLLVVSGSSASPSEGDTLSATSTSISYTITTPASFSTGDWTVAASTTRDSSATCTLTMGKITAISSYLLTVSAGTAGLTASSAAVYNLGNPPSIHAYAVRDGNLTMCDYLAYNCGSTSYTTTLNSTVWVPVASHIASLRAQYGRDTTDLSTPAMDGVVDSYDQITPGSSSDTSGLSSYCSWMRVIGLRLAVVAKSQQYDRNKPTTSAPTWSGSTANTSTSTTLTTVTPTALPLTLSGNSDWQYYRYKTFESTVPLRNTIWNGNQATYQSGSVKC